MAYLTDIERLNYYEGEFLGAVDFQAEQDYHRDMRRRHNLGQHTWGIVTGLELVQAPNGNTTSSGATEVDVFLAPGMAVDGLGREIVVLNQAQLTTSMLAAYYSSQSASKLIYVWIGYQQSLLDPPSDACAAMNVSNAYARIQETYTLSVTQNASPPSATPLVVVNGLPTAPPAEPSSSSSGSGSPPPTPDPPPITLPYDNSVPYQEFSTDDSSIIWWIPIGAVYWDLNNQVFLQITASTPGASAAEMGREYVGNVSETTYAPGGRYTIVDRDSPSPAVASASDSNLGGVTAEVAGSLQIDFLLDAELTALIGAKYDTTNPVTRPLTIVDNGDKSLSLLEFRSSSGQTPTWYISQLGNGVSGLNFGQVVPPSGGGKPTPTDGILFFNTGPVGAGNVGVGTTSPLQNLSVYAGLSIDEANVNPGGTSFPTSGANNLLTFGTNAAGPSSGGSGEGIGSQRIGAGNQYGLDFYTKFSRRMTIDNSGNVGIGVTPPAQQNLSVNAGLNIDQADANAGTLPTSGANAALTFGSSSGEGIGSCRVSGDPNYHGLDFYTGYNRQLSIAHSGNVGIGIGSQTALQNLSVNAGLNIDQANSNPGGASFASGPNNLLTFGTNATGASGGGSGEGIGSQRTSGTNQYGLDFYTGFNRRMTIKQDGNVGIGTSSPLAPLHVAAISGLSNSALPIVLIESNSSPGPSPRLGLVDTSQGSNTGAPVWFIDNAEDSFRIFRQPNYTTGGTTYLQIDNSGDVTIPGNINGTKVGYVADRFINRDGAKLERGDIVVLHPTPSSQYYGSGGRVPLVEVQLADAAFDTRVCGIVDEPALAQSKLRDLDRTKLGKVQVGLMVTLGAYAFCKVDADIAPISPGDLLTTSPTPGHAQKLGAGESNSPGIIIAKAMGELKSGKGMIPVLVSHQ